MPVFGHMRLDQVKTMQIVDFLEKLSQPGSRKDGKEGALSSSTVRFHHRILKNIFARAVEWKVIKENPVDGVQKPKENIRQIEPYDEEEFRQLLLALQGAPFHWRMMVTLALTTGLRRGELLGLEWSHIDWKTGVIDVVQSVPKTRKGTSNVKSPKNNKTRKVTLPGSVLIEMKEYYAYRVKERDKLADAWEGGDRFFMFAHANGRPFIQEQPYHWFQRFTKRKGLRTIRFHDLRHTSATLLINQGVHAKIISERLGHSSIGVTMNIYGHALRSADQAAADKFDNLLPLAPKKDEKKTQGHS